MHDFRSRKSSSEVCDDQGFVKSSLDIARSGKQTPKNRRYRSEQLGEIGMPTPCYGQTKDSPLLVGTPVQFENPQPFALDQSDCTGESIKVENRVGAARMTMSRIDKAATAKPGSNYGSARHARKQLRRNKTKDLLSSPATSSSSDSDTLDQPSSPLISPAESGERSDGLALVGALGAGSHDPFDALPIAGTPRVQTLIHHCKQPKFKPKA